MIIPGTRPPWFGAGLSSFESAFTLSAGVISGYFSPEGAAALFDAMDAQIPRS